MDKSSTPSLVASTFNQLTLGVELGSGAFGVVYKATYQGDTYAVKQLHKTKHDEASKAAFLKEIDVMAKLRSPNIVSIYNHIKAEPYSIVMEYMPKGSLYELLKNQDEKLEWPLRYRIALDIGKGLYFLHNQHIIHRDLKSLNVLIDKEYCAKIADFGLAKLLENSGHMTLGGPGSLPWTAPEVLNNKPASYASDMYAYGMILWEIAARQLPFVELKDNPVALIKKVALDHEREAMPISTPPAFQKTIKACWDQAPDKRPDTLTAMIQLKEGQQLQAEQGLNVNTPATAQAPQASVKPSKQEATTTGPLYQSKLIATPTPEDIIKAVTAMLKAKEWSSEQKAYFKALIQTVSLPPGQVLQGHTADVTALALLPNGQLASGSWDATIKLWDLASGTCTKTLQGHTKYVTTLLMLPNGQLASGAWDYTIKLWDLTSGTCKKTLQGHIYYVTTLLMLPNGQLASGAWDYTIKCWDLTSGTCTKTLQGHTKPVKTLLMLPNGQLVSGSSDNTLKLWDLDSGICQQTLQEHTNAVNTLLLLPNGQLVSGSSDNTLKFWDLDNGTCLKTLTTQHPIITLRLLGNARLLSSTGGEIQCWHLDNGQCEQRYGGLTGGTIHDLLPLASTEWIAASGPQIQRFNLAATLREALTGARQGLSTTGEHYGFFKRQALSQLKRAPKTLVEHTSSVNTLLLLSNGLLASGSNDTTIKLWDLGSGICQNTLRGHTSYVNTLLLLPNGQLASGSWDTTIKLWDLDSGTCTKTLQGHSKSVKTLLLLPNGQLASGAWDYTIKLWDLDSRTCKKTLQGHTNAVNTLLMLPNGQLASGAWDTTIKLWDLDSGTCTKTLQGHTNAVNTLIMLPNGLLASGSSDNTLKLWDLDSGTCQKTLQGHTNAVNTLLMLPNGLLASGSSDNTLKLWDLDSGTCQKTLMGHSEDVNTLLLLPNGQLASGAWDYTIKLWDPNLTLTLEELERKAPECKMM